jgi:dihydrofolate reductase
VIISIIVAMDERRGIGANNKLPWRLSSDLRRFRQLTMGHHIIMGRKTYESIGKPLPGRETIVVTRNPDYKAEGCRTVHSVEDAISLAVRHGESEAFICGGAEIYAESLGFADRIYLTLVHTESNADTFFPQIDEPLWVEEGSSYYPADEKNEHPHTYMLLVKREAA